MAKRNGENPESMSANADIDRSLKVLVRRAPRAFFRLAGADIRDRPVRVTDVSVNVPEHRADNVLLVGAEDDPQRYAVHVESVMYPKAGDSVGWLFKNAALGEALKLPVVTLVVYLRRGRRRTFPASYRVERDGFVTTFSFDTVRLWEHDAMIRSGELAELAPLLVLCEDIPEEATLRRERELIRSLDVEEEVRADLLSIAATLGGRYFTGELLRRVFQEELEVLKTYGLVAELINEGRQEGQLQGAQNTLLRLLRNRFGELPETVDARVRSMNAEAVDALLDQIIEAPSLGDLGLVPEAAD